MKFSAGRKDESAESEGPLLCETLAQLCGAIRSIADMSRGVYRFR